MLKIQTKYCDFIFLKKPDTKVASFDLQRALKQTKHKTIKLWPSGLRLRLLLLQLGRLFLEVEFLGSLFVILQQFPRFQIPIYVLKYQCLIIIVLKETFDPVVSFLFLEKWRVKTFRFHAQLSKGIWHMAYYDVVSRRSLPVLIFPAYFPVLLLQFDKLFIVFLVCYTYMIYVHKIAYVSPLYQFLSFTNFHKFSK